MPQTEKIKVLDSGSYFGSTDKAVHSVSNDANSEAIIYIRTNGALKIGDVK